MKHVTLYYPEVSYIKGGPHDLHRFPYAILHLLPGLKDAGFRVDWSDGRIDERLVFLKSVYQKPLYVGVSSLTGIQLLDAMESSKKVKEIDPKIPVVWGGWHASLLPEEVLKEDFVDIVCIGQGEETSVELAKALQEGLPLETVKGIAFKGPNGIVRTEPRPLVQHLPRIPWDSIDINKYGPYIGYLTSFGCPWNCAFCAIAKVYTHKWWFRDLDEVVADLKYLADNRAVVNFNIDDDNFFIKKERVIDFCNKWAGYKNIPISVLAHVRLVEKYDDEMWSLLRKSGICTILIGAESANQTMLDRLHKHQTPAQMMEFVKVCTKHGIVPELSFLTGFPDSEEIGDFRDTIEFLAQAGQVNPYLQYKLFWIRPYPGTELYEEFKKDWPMPRTMKQWSEYTLRNWPVWVSREMEEMVNYFVFAFQRQVGWNYTWESFLHNFKMARRNNQIPRQVGI